MTDGSRSGPLRDLRVVELAGLGPTPFGAMLLADLGADVIRIDRPDPGPISDELIGDAILRGRTTVSLDLKHPDAAEVVLRLVESADALVEGFRPGVTERLGIGPEPCLARNPGLVYGRMTGWGQTGPLAATAGHDLDYIALTGTLGAIGRPGELPVPPLNLLGDFGGGGMLLAFGVVSAVLEARWSGRGQVLDAAMTDGSALLATALYGMRNAGLWPGGRGENLLDGGAPFYDTYRTADGEAVALAALEPRFYAELLERLGLEDPAGGAHLDPATWPAIRTALTAAVGARTRAELDELFAGSDACYAPVLDLDQAPAHPHNVARRTFYDAPGGPLPSPAPRFSETPAATPAPPDRSVAALEGWGFNRAEVAELVAAGIARA